MKPKLNSLLRAPMLMLLAALATACSSVSPPLSPQPVPPPRIPALSPLSRQPAIPSECLPTCSAALTSERESWLNTPTPPALPGQGASGTMTR